MYSAKSRTESGAHPAIGDQQCNVMLHAVQKASSLRFTKQYSNEIARI